MTSRDYRSKFRTETDGTPEEISEIDPVLEDLIQEILKIEIANAELIQTLKLPLEIMAQSAPNTYVEFNNLEVKTFDIIYPDEFDREFTRKVRIEKKERETEDIEEVEDDNMDVYKRKIGVGYDYRTIFSEAISVLAFGPIKLTQDCCDWILDVQEFLDLTLMEITPEMKFLYKILVNKLLRSWNKTILIIKNIEHQDKKEYRIAEAQLNRAWRKWGEAKMSGGIVKEEESKSPIKADTYRP